MIVEELLTTLGGDYLTDEKIIELFFARDENAINEIQKKYGGFCHTVASNILNLREDREECINDVYLALWRNIPPEKPVDLKAYLAKIVRNLALKHSESNNVWKRCANYMTVSEEFLSIIPDPCSLSDQFQASQVGKIISNLLKTLPDHESEIFVLHYYFGESISSVAHDMGFTIGKVKSILMRTRQKLAKELKKEGIII